MREPRDDRQEAIRRVWARISRPGALWTEPSRRGRPSSLQRLWISIRGILRRK